MMIPWALTLHGGNIGGLNEVLELLDLLLQLVERNKLVLCDTTIQQRLTL